MGKLIVRYSRENAILGVYSTPEEASNITGINKSIILMNLIGTAHDCSDGSRFRYEVTAGELRDKKKEEKRIKEIEKIKGWF